MGPRGRGRPLPRRGEGVGDKAYLSYFVPCCVQLLCCILPIWFFGWIMLDSFMLHYIEYDCCPNMLPLSICILHSTMFRLIRPG